MHIELLNQEVIKYRAYVSSSALRQQSLPHSKKVRAREGSGRLPIMNSRQQADQTGSLNWMMSKTGI